MELPVVVKEILESEDIKSIQKIDLKNVEANALIGLFNFIPIVGGGIAAELQVAKDARSSYLEMDFFRKLLAVIYGVQDLEPKDIQNFNKEISEKAHDNSGNVLTCIIDKMDNINKATILANLIRARIEKKISVHEFFRLSVMLERIPYVDLNELGRYQEPYYDNSGDTELLYATGALKLAIIDANDENKYTLSKLGALLLEKGMNYDTIKSSKGCTDIKQLEWEEIS